MADPHPSSPDAPTRRAFSARYAHPRWGIALMVVGALEIVGGAAQLSRGLGPSALAAPIVIGVGFIAWGIYLVRGQGTKPAIAPDAMQRPTTPAAATAAPPPVSKPRAPAVSHGASTWESKTFRIDMSSSWGRSKLRKLTEEGWEVVSQTRPGSGLLDSVVTTIYTMRRALPVAHVEPEAGDATAQSGSPASEGSVGQRIAELADLHDRGMLTDDEFAAAKAKVLGTA